MTAVTVHSALEAGTVRSVLELCPPLRPLSLVMELLEIEPCSHLQAILIYDLTKLGFAGLPLGFEDFSLRTWGHSCRTISDGFGLRLVEVGLCGVCEGT
jgi:hypothetical protein